MRLLVMMGLVLGCASYPGEGEEAGVAEGLASTLEVQVEGDQVRFTLSVTNATEAPIRLDFPSSQRYDFAVERPSGEIVWTWSAARSFAQMLGEETLAPGETVTYSERWDDPAGAGRYVAVGRLTAMNVEVERRASFDLSE